MCHALRDTGTSLGPCPQGWQTSHAVHGSSWWMGRVRGSDGRPRTGWWIIPGRAETWGKPRLSSSGKAAPGPRGECSSWRLPGARPAAGRPGRTPGPLQAAATPALAAPPTSPTWPCRALCPGPVLLPPRLAASCSAPGGPGQGSRSALAAPGPARPLPRTCVRVVEGREKKVK